MSNINTTTLSGLELALIEELVKLHGNVVSSDMIYEILERKGGISKRQASKNFISKLVLKGWLVRVKRGTFIVSDIANRGVAEASQLAIAQVIDDNSYISFEAALQYYGMFDQYLRVISSVGTKKTYNKSFQGTLYRFVKAKNNLFKDYGQFNIDDRLVAIANKEKIIIDFLVYRKSLSSIDLILEKLGAHKNDFDFQQMIALSKNTSITVMRTLGIIFDLLDIESDQLHRLIAGRNSHSFMTKESNIFNAKWRIYTDKYLEKYKNETAEQKRTD